MSRTATISISSHVHILTVLNELLSSVNVCQRIRLDNAMEKAGFDYRPSFLASDVNRDENGKKLWTNGSVIHSSSFTTTTILFSLNGEKAIMVNADIQENRVTASMPESEEHTKFLMEIVADLRERTPFDVALYDNDENIVSVVDFA